MRIIFPPRPRGKITPGELVAYEKTGLWVVQRKFNGQRSPVFISPEGKAQLFSRYGRGHENYVPPAGMMKEFAAFDLDLGTYYWFDAELLGTKTQSAYYDNRLVIFDVLHIGKSLFNGPNLMQRQEILKKICRNPSVLEKEHGIALQITEHIWLAETFENGFVARFKELLGWPEIEGLVLKKKNSVIDNIGARENEVNWQIRCRKAHEGGNYAY